MYVHIEISNVVTGKQIVFICTLEAWWYILIKAKSVYTMPQALSKVFVTSVNFRHQQNYLASK